MWIYFFTIAFPLCAGFSANQFNDIQSNTDIDDQLFAIQEDVTKNSILLHNKKDSEEVETLIAEVRDKCQCVVEDLSHVKALVLRYPNSSHGAADSFLQINGIIKATEDDIVLPPKDLSRGSISLEAEEEIKRPIDPTPSPPPNDPFLPFQWGLVDVLFREDEKNTDINWLEGKSKYDQDTVAGDKLGPEVVVAVIDSGIDYNHPDIKDAMWKNPGEIPNNGIDDDENGIIDDIYGASFVEYESIFDKLANSKNNPLDKDIDSLSFGHGTSCAGIIAASTNNAEGIAGVAGDTKGKVKLMAIKVFGRAFFTAFSWLVKGLNYAIANKARISNISYGLVYSRRLRDYNEIFEAILKDNPQHLFISSAGDGNRKVNDDDWPGGISLPNTISVAASTFNDERAEFSNYGKPFINVFAPGKEIIVTRPLNNYNIESGTNLAAPYVAGLAALLMSMREGISPSLVKDLIEESVQKKSKYKDLVTSGGLIDVERSIEALIGRIKPSCKKGKRDRGGEACVDRCGCESPRKGWSSSSQRCRTGSKTSLREKCEDRCSCDSPKTGWDSESQTCKRGFTTFPGEECVDRCGCKSPQQGWSSSRERCRTGSTTTPKDDCELPSEQG